MVKRAFAPPDVLVVGLTTVALFTLWAGTDGGYAEVVWYPGGLLLLILAGMAAWATPTRPLGGRSAVAVGFLAAYTCWSYLSIVWAGDRGLALIGANRTLTYLLVLLVVIGRRWSWEQATAYIWVWAGGVVVVGAVMFARVAYAAHPAASFTGGRLIVPIDYANANAALFTLAAWPLVVCAQSRAVPAVIRAVSLAAAGVAVELALLAQSKGGALATAAVLVLLAAVAPRRVRLFVPVALVAAVVALFHGPLFRVYDSVSQGDDSASATRAALSAIGASVLVLLVSGAIVAIVERSLDRLGERRARLVNALAAAAGIVALVVGAAAAVERFGNPASVASHAWHAFKHPARTTAASSHFATSAGNHRYDFWRVAVHQVESSPLLGAGADNFAADYLRLRRSSEEPLYPHSLEARVLGGTGLIGFLLFGGFVASAGLLCLSAARSRLPGRGTLGLAAVSIFGYWLAHGSVDWLWEFPALTGPALATVACTASCVETAPRGPWSKRARRALAAASIVAAVAAAVALGPAWLAARETSLGVQVWRAEPALAYERLDQAARLNRLSDQPYLIAGTVAERKRDWQRAGRYFTLALDRNSSNWYALLERGIANELTHQHAAAISDLEQAQRLDPREPIIRGVLEDVHAGRPIEITSLDRAMLERTEVQGGR
jgi:hypothetical protein